MRLQDCKKGMKIHFVKQLSYGHLADAVGNEFAYVIPELIPKGTLGIIIGVKKDQIGIRIVKTFSDLKKTETDLRNILPLYNKEKYPDHTDTIDIIEPVS
jgi:hypothetical protein